MKKSNSSLPVSPPPETDLVRLVQELEHVQQKLKHLDNSDEAAQTLVEETGDRHQEAINSKQEVLAINRRARNLLTVQLANLQELILPLVGEDNPIRNYMAYVKGNPLFNTGGNPGE